MTCSLQISPSLKCQSSASTRNHKSLRRRPLTRRWWTFDLVRHERLGIFIVVIDEGIDVLLDSVDRSERHAVQHLFPIVSQVEIRAICPVGCPAAKEVRDQYHGKENNTEDYQRRQEEIER